MNHPFANRVSEGAPDPLIIHHGRVVLPDRILEDHSLLMVGGRIAAIGKTGEVDTPAEAREIDAVEMGVGYVSPGFIDIHVHGGGGADYMDGTEEAVRIANRCHARHGVTTIFPTTTTGSPARITAMLRAVRGVRDGWSVADGSRVGGVHLYGPYFAADKLGAHPLEGRRDPDAAEYHAAFDLGVVRIATCAAELPGAADFYAEAGRRGCLVTCGHSNASFEEMRAAFEAGMRHVDHFWCAMSSVKSVTERLGVPMRGSMEQFVLMERGMSTEVIADGKHLAPELLEFALRMIGPERLCLVSDTSRAMDMPAGEYVIGPREAGRPIRSDTGGGYTLDTGKLASSVRGLDFMVRHMHANTSADVATTIRLASLTPAERVGISDETGSLEVGKLADVVLLGDDLSVRQSLIGGRAVGPMGDA